MNILSTVDSLSQWLSKINDQLFGSSVVKEFYNDPNQSYTPDVLDFFVEGGILRTGITFVTIPASLLRLNNNAVNWVCINTTPSSEALAVYADGAVPATEIIPLFRVTVDIAFNVTLIEDIRTWAVR